MQRSSVRCMGLCAGMATDKIQGGMKKFMWYTLMNEFKCKASSTWWRPFRCDGTRICNDNKAWATWDHFPIHARICEDYSDVPLRRRRKKNWCGRRPRSKEQKEYMRKLLKDKEGSLNDLYVDPEQIEEAARKIAHFTKG